MMDEQDDERLPDRLLEAARDYHAPLPTPREEMWVAIAAERGAPPGRPGHGAPPALGSGARGHAGAGHRDRTARLALRPA